MSTNVSKNEQVRATRVQGKPTNAAIERLAKKLQAAAAAGSGGVERSYSRMHHRHNRS